MKPLAALLLCLLLAACAPVSAPVVVYVTQGPPDYLTAGEIVHVATVTAVAQATESARETAVRLGTEQALQDARDVATLSAAQTQSALSLAMTVGAATQAAQITATVQAGWAAQTQAWATPTWAALRTQAAAERAGISATGTQIAINSERAQANADSYRNLWSAAWVIGALLLLMLAALVVYWANQRLMARHGTVEATEGEKTDRERLATEKAMIDLERARLELMKAAIVYRDGEPWLIRPDGRMMPMVPGLLAPVSQPNLAREWRWKAAAKKAVFAGVWQAGEAGMPQFGERDLAGRDPEQCWIVNADGKPSSAGYRHIKKILVTMGIWLVTGQNTVFAPAWTAERFEREFDRIPLLELPEGEPPDVRIPPRISTPSALSAFSAAPQTDDGIEAAAPDGALGPDF